MTRDEFATWGRHHQAIFPDFSVWWERLKVENKTSAAEISRQWMDILSRVALDDALEASNRMLAGTVELCPAWERSMLASRIATTAREIASDRMRPSRATETPKRHQPHGPHASGLLAEIMRRVDAGEDPRAAAAAVIPKAEPSQDGPRYSCNQCNDTGIVSVWSNHSVQSAMAGTITNPANRRTMGVACACHAADYRCLPDDRTAPKNWSGWRQSARYAPESYCRCHNSDVDHPDRIAELLEWVGDYASKKVQAPEHMRQPAFDQWNQS